jgi:integrase/recombinase XerD
MIKHVPNPETRNQLVLRLLFETGVRNHELHHMKVEHIDRDERSIQVQNRKTKDHGDDDSWRTVWWQPGPTDTLISTWIDHLRDTNYSARKSDRLFVTERSGNLAKRRISELVSQVADKAGIQEVLYTDPSGADRKRVTPHTLRHGHAVHAVRQGIDIAFIQEHMGHNDISTTKTYLQFKPSDIQDEYAKF